MTTPLVELEGVRFSYPGPRSFQLEIQSLGIGAGERIACIGPSGSGKTTLVNLITGIETPQTGVVRFGGQAISAMADAARRRVRLRDVGMVFQEFELLEYLTGLDNILLAFALGAPRDERARARAEELARACGIGQVVRRRPRRLSQGERQRVAICRALVTSPMLVVADEPTGNLDPDTGGAVLDLLLEQVSSRGATLLMVTHNHAVLDRFDRVIDMRDLTRGAVA
ncbi:MAG: ABC transporter ATP-binding protein [Phycisphaerales bacterium JB039]